MTDAPSWFCPPADLPAAPDRRDMLADFLAAFRVALAGDDACEIDEACAALCDLADADEAVAAEVDLAVLTATACMAAGRMRVAPSGDAAAPWATLRLVCEDLLDGALEDLMRPAAASDGKAVA